VTRYFYQGARLAIQAEARNVKASAGGARLATAVRAADGYGILEVRFRSGLFYKQSVKVRVTFDLPGGAPRSKSDIRGGSRFARFVRGALGRAARAASGSARGSPRSWRGRSATPAPSGSTCQRGSTRRRSAPT